MGWSVCDDNEPWAGYRNRTAVTNLGGRGYSQNKIRPKRVAQAS
jgi:hypothetical protein